MVEAAAFGALTARFRHNVLTAHFAERAVANLPRPAGAIGSRERADRISTAVEKRSARARPATSRPAQRVIGSGVSPARSAFSAAAVMFLSMPPNTTPWNGEMDRQ